MSEAFFSQSWYRVATLKPALAGDVRVHRHRYSGGAWYVLEDRLTGRTHRLSPAAYSVAGRLDGIRTVDAIWTEVAEKLNENAPTQDAVISLLAQLHASDLLRTDVTPDLVESVERRRKQNRVVLKQNLMNPVGLRMPLFDPDRLLGALLPFVRPFIGPLGLLIWLAVVGPAVFVAGRHWTELTQNIFDRVLSIDNLIVLALSYPIIKAFHEGAHGLVAKRYGASVPEVGAMFLVFVPMPYVDVSGASAFRSKWQRAAVGAAGILIETFLAALALYAWLAAEPGTLRAVLFNIMLIGGVSTLLVNGNPLIRFDGYYILADLIGMPNLSQRANRYVQHVVENRIFGNDSLRPFVATAREKAMFLFYAPVSFLYRVTLTASIAVFIAQRYFVVGAAFALWMVAQSLVMPLAKGFWQVVSSARLRRIRTRALTVIGATVAALAVALFGVPAPSWTLAQGVVWLPETANVRAGTAGFLDHLATAVGTEVKAGDPLAVFTDPALDTRIAAAAWKVRELELKLAANTVTDKVLAETTRIELANARQQLDRERVRRTRMVAVSHAAGRFVTDKPASDLAGRFFKEGDLIGYVLPDHSSIVRVVVPQDTIDQVRSSLVGVTLRPGNVTGESRVSSVLRAVPAGLFELPSSALSRSAGGPIPTDPRDTKGLTALQRVFQFDLDLPADAASAGFGERVDVRFQHRAEPIGLQLYRRARQMFLSAFDV